MCTLTMALAGLGAGVSAYGAVQAGNAQAAQYEYQAQVSRQNAELERRKANDASERGRLEEYKTREKGRQFAASQRAALAGSGTQIDTGSPLAMQVDTAGLVERDAAKDRYNSQMERWGFLSNASQYESQGKSYDSAAGSVKQAGLFNAASSLLGGASSLSSQWDFWKQGGKNKPALLGGGIDLMFSLSGRNDK